MTLRRFSTCMFALLLFALAFSISADRSTTPPHLTGLGALFLPHVAYAQATASAPGQTVADNPNAVVVVDTGPGVEKARAAVPSDNANHSHSILWIALAVIALLVAGAWVFKRRKNPEPRYGGDYSSSDSEAGRGKERTRGGP